MAYFPDKWVVVKITTEDDGTYYKVLAGWDSIYDSSWRLNSGITKAFADDGYIRFYGLSGSQYNCDIDSYGTIGESTMILKSLIQGGDVELMPADTDWVNMEYKL